MYLRQEDHLVPEYANGDNLSLFSALRIPLGEGLSGWVAETQKAIINGNPSVEFGYLNDPTKFTLLRSALAIPLCGLEGNCGVVALYHKQADFFDRARRSPGANEIAHFERAQHHQEDARGEVRQ